jgi:division/cell wall cluster transcriptional repressor MraZ
MMADVLIGNYSARFDASGRIKVPEKFREVIQTKYGRELFVTSLTDESVQIYPLAVWLEMTGMTSEGALHLRPDVRKFMLRVNRNGSRHELDSKGRVLISQALREKARLEEEVEVIGLSNHLEVWNKDALDRLLEEKPLSEADLESIARLVPRGQSE